MQTNSAVASRISSLQDDFVRSDQVFDSGDETRLEVLGKLRAALGKIDVKNDLNVGDPDSVTCFVKIAEATLKAQAAREKAADMRVNTKLRNTEVQTNKTAGEMLMSINNTLKVRDVNTIPKEKAASILDDADAAIDNLDATVKTTELREDPHDLN